jgi:Domain of unknown function (DUF4349)
MSTNRVTVDLLDGHIVPETSVASTLHFASDGATPNARATRAGRVGVVGGGRFTPAKRAGAALGVAMLVAVSVAGCSQDRKLAADTTVSMSAQPANGLVEFSAETEAALASETMAAASGDLESKTIVVDQAAPLDGSGSGAAAPSTGGSAIPVTPQTGAQIKRAELTVQLSSAQFRSGVAQATQLPGSVGGFVQSSQVSGGNPIDDKRNEPRFAVVVMRVPSARFDDVRGRLGGLGKLTSENISGEEVSAQLVDMQARMTSLLLQEDAYKKLFNAATKIQDIITVQERLTEVRTQIEQISAQKANLGNQVAMSTITLNLQEKVKVDAAVAKPKVKKAKGFSSQVSQSWNNGTKALGNVLTALVVVFVALAPFIPLMLIGGLLALYLLRRTRQADAARLASSMEVAPTAVKAATEPAPMEPDLVSTDAKA